MHRWFPLQVVEGHLHRDLDETVGAQFHRFYYVRAELVERETFQVYIVRESENLHVRLFVSIMTSNVQIITKRQSAVLIHYVRSSLDRTIYNVVSLEFQKLRPREIFRAFTPCVVLSRRSEKRTETFCYFPLHETACAFMYNEITLFTCILIHGREERRPEHLRTDCARTPFRRNHPPTLYTVIKYALYLSRCKNKPFPKYKSIVFLNSHL